MKAVEIFSLFLTRIRLYNRFPLHVNHMVDKALGLTRRIN